MEAPDLLALLLVVHKPRPGRIDANEYAVGRFVDVTRT